MMPAEDYSDQARWTFGKLNKRLGKIARRIREADKLGLPLKGLFDEGERVLAALDQWMEQKKGTPFYDAYWKARQTKGQLPTMPPGFDPRWQ